MAIKQSGHGTHIKHFSWLNVPHISPQGRSLLLENSEVGVSSFATDGFASLHMGLP